MIIKGRIGSFNETEIELYNDCVNTLRYIGNHYISSGAAGPAHGLRPRSVNRHDRGHSNHLVGENCGLFGGGPQLMVLASDMATESDVVVPHVAAPCFVQGLVSA